MKLLISNIGSTSLKFKLFSMPEEKLLCESRVERVGSWEGATFYYRSELCGTTIQKESCSIPTYTEGIQRFLTCLISPDGGVLSDLSELDAVGFKTVLAKGFYGVHELTDEVLRGMEDYLFVAPAHNGPYLEAISKFSDLLPQTKLVGVFETAFHVDIPEARRLYSIPYEWHEKYGIKRMGYHGASHSYVAETLGSAGKVISCHMGGSSSVCAIAEGKSVDNSFGFSLQTGLPHANRSGDLDPYVVMFLMNEGLSTTEIINGLSRRGGLLGLSGVSNDLREIEAAAKEGNRRAELATDVLAESVIHYIGAYYAKLGGLDSLVFTGGIGENSALMRKKICAPLRHMGIILDEEKNNSGAREMREISTETSPVRVLVIPANEEIGLARRTQAFLRGEIMQSGEGKSW